MEIFRSLRHSSKAEHWQDALEWLVYSAIFNLMPLWATILLLKAFGGKPIELPYLTEKGEFLLYAASYLGGALYLVFRDWKTKSFPSRRVLGPILFFILFPSALLFGGIALIGILGESGAPQLASYINREFLQTTSLIALPFSAILAYIVTVADNIRTSPEVTEIQKQQLKRLNDDFDHL